MLRNTLLTFLIIALLPCLVYSQSNDDQENQRHIHVTQNPIFPELVSYIKYKENSMQISRILENQEYKITTICQNEIINDGWGEEDIDIESLGCSSFEWRPIIDENDNLFYSLVSGIENKIYIGFINKDMECDNKFSCGFNMLSVNLEESYNIQRPVWSPDGTMLLFEADGSIFLIEALHDLKNLQNRTFTDKRVIENGSYPQWSPDQRFITYEHEGDIFIMYADEMWSNENDPVVFNVDEIYRRDIEYTKVRPTWSTDGKLISYFAEDSINTNSYTWNIIVRELLEGEGSIRLRNYGREIFQVKDVDRSSNDGPLIIASDANETENKSYYATYIDNNPDEEFPVMMKELVTGTDRPEISTISDSKSHINNYMLDVQVYESTLYFAYSSQINDSTQKGLEINYEYRTLSP